MPLGDDIRFRRAVLEDAVAILAYAHALGAENLDTIPSGMDAFSLDQERRWIASVEETKNAFILVGLAELEVIALGDFRPVQGERGRTPQGSLGMTVAKAYRGRGIGRRLLTLIIDEALRERPELARIELDVVPWNTNAIQLYESFGFEIEGRRRNAITSRGPKEDLLLMAKIF